MSKTIVYNGEHEQVEIRPPYGEHVIRRGKPVEVDDELADRLLGEYPDDYTAAEPATKKKA